MKKSLLKSFIEGINSQEGDQYPAIFKYFWPEFVTNLLLYSLPFIVDSCFLGHISTQAFVTAGVTNTLLHWFVKIAEGLSVASIILTGQYNGAGDKEGAGTVFSIGFWVSCLVGTIIGFILYSFAPVIFYFYGVTPDVARMGIAYLKLRSIGIVIMFMYQASIGFLRGIKNTRIPMISFVSGTLVFLVLDYLLIFGNGSIQALGINGSAIATIVQYCVSTGIVLAYILFSPEVRPYAVKLFAPLRKPKLIKSIVFLSAPVILDKSSLAIAYIWLTTIINPLGTNVGAAFCTVRTIQSFAFLPAIALAQVITFLVSNYIGAGSWRSVKSTVKRVLFASTALTYAILIVIALFSNSLVRFLFDGSGDFTSLVVKVFPIISIFICFDLIQVILSGALRGAANVWTVMMVRMVVIVLFLVPTTYAISLVHVADDLKLIFIYSSFYIGNALMALAFMYQFRTDRWKKFAGIKDD